MAGSALQNTETTKQYNRDRDRLFQLKPITVTIAIPIPMNSFILS
jgi:hypothetical protein